LVLILARVNAIKTWRTLMGPANVELAQKEAPRSLRAMYRSNAIEDIVHGSDSAETAQREIKFFFPKQHIFPSPNSEQARDYVNANLVPTLTEGLAQLCKNKPVDPVLWLAKWMLANNPNKPRVTEP